MLALLMGVVLAAGGKLDLSSKLQLPQFEKVSTCHSKPAFLNEVRGNVVALHKLPKAVFVASGVEMYVEGKADNGTPVQAYALQSFTDRSKRERGQVVCGSSAQGLAERLPILAPALFDTTDSQSVGTSLWQFQLIMGEGQFAMSGYRTPAQESLLQLEKSLVKSGGNYQISQVSHNEFELLVTKPVKNLRVTLLVRYQVMKF